VRGKIFVNVRALTDDLDHVDISYEETEQFLRFVDKYVTHAIGNHQLGKWLRANTTKTLLDKVTASDIAYTILVYENTKEVWEEEIEIKASDKTDEEKRSTARLRRPKYHEGRGKRLKRYADGWTDVGKSYYEELMMTFKDLKSHTVWMTIKEHWTCYQMRHYGRNYSRAELNTDNNHEESDEETDEEHWRIDLEDKEDNASDFEDDFNECVASPEKRAKV